MEGEGRILGTGAHKGTNRLNLYERMNEQFNFTRVHGPTVLSLMALETTNI